MTSHALHQGERPFPESNCYVDLWIELLHGLDLDPTASLSFAFSTGFEGDQWTFFKPPHADLYALYGVEVQELCIYRPLHEQVLAQVALGRPVLVEVDAFFLPDTEGVSYRREHVKTTVAVRTIDLEARSLGYFHNAGYFALGAEDFAGIFRLDHRDARTLDPYVEIAKLDRLTHRSPADLTAVAVTCAREHLARRSHGAVACFGARFEEDLAVLIGGDLAAFHRYVFATLRQLGSCAQMGAAFARWLGVHGAAAGLDEVAAGAKALLFKTARAVNAGRSFSAAPAFAAMAAAWEGALDTLSAAVER